MHEPRPSEQMHTQNPAKKLTFTTCVTACKPTGPLGNIWAASSSALISLPPAGLLPFHSAESSAHAIHNSTDRSTLIVRIPKPMCVSRSVHHIKMLL